jgi:catechol 2,3-dioxygenase-like lactoylglutathione lyase family enzyme
MSIDLLDHVSIRTADVAATRRFYTDILGFEDGARPPFPFPGAWLYQSGRPVIHVIGIDPDKPAGLTDYLGERESKGGTGSIDHIAFTARDVAAMRTHFQARDIPFRERTVPALNLAQLFVEDPNGVVIELNFPN